MRGADRRNHLVDQLLQLLVAGLCLRQPLAQARFDRFRALALEPVLGFEFL